MTTAELKSKVLAMESNIAELRERVERSEIDAAVRRSEAEFARGEGIPLRKAIEMSRRKHNLPARRAS